MKIQARILVFVMLASSTGPLAQAGPPEYTPRPRQTTWQATYSYAPNEVIPLELGTEGVWVPVVTASIDGHPVRLVLDTATRGVATLNPEVIRDLNLKQIGEAQFLDAAGRPHGTRARVLVPSLEIGPVTLRDVTAMETGPESVQGVRKGFAGTLGWHAFNEGRITVDYANRLVAFSRSPLPPEIHGCGDRWVTRFQSPAGLDGLPIVEASVGSTAFFAEIDTGKSATLLSSQLPVSPGREPSDRITIELELGPFSVTTRFARIGAGFAGIDENLEQPLLLGAGTDVLSGFLLTIDYPSRTLVLEREPCPVPAEEGDAGSEEQAMPRSLAPNRLQ